MSVVRVLQTYGCPADFHFYKLYCKILRVIHAAKKRQTTDTSIIKKINHRHFGKLWARLGLMIKGLTVEYPLLRICLKLPTPLTHFLYILQII